MFIAALFTIAKIWKQSKCPARDDWIKYICKNKYININIYVSIYIQWNATQP